MVVEKAEFSVEGYQQSAINHQPRGYSPGRTKSDGLDILTVLPNLQTSE
jgi:hypothetical protein